MNLQSYTYLKIFKKLKVLNIRENPFARKEPEYENHLVFHLHNLQYIDHFFISEERRNDIRGKFKEGDDPMADINMRIKMEEEEKQKNLRRKKLQVFTIIFY